MAPVTDPDWQGLDRYLAGELAPGERERFERWLSERPERAAQAAAFRNAIELATLDVSAEEREAMWAGIIGGPAEGGASRPAATLSLEPRAVA
nr:hypothetical protein [Gemmatimonadales bacterium]